MSKQKKIEIITSLQDGMKEVRAFAKENSGDLETMKIHGALTKANTLVSFIFTPNRDRKEVEKDFLERFQEHNPRVRRQLMFCD